MRGHPQLGSRRCTNVPLGNSVQNITGNGGEETRLASLCLCAGIGIDGSENGIERAVGPGRNGKFKPTVDQEVGCSRRLSQKDGVLITHRDDGGTKCDVPRMLADCRKEG
ncbi:hypothetical protein D3C72_1332250 [compost metagenome]